MSALGLLVALAALAVASSWLVAVCAVGAWRIAWRLAATAPRCRAALARWVPATLAAGPVLGVATTLALVLPTGRDCHCALDAALHVCLTHPERAMPLAPVALVALVAFAALTVPHARGVMRRLRAGRALAGGRGPRTPSGVRSRARGRFVLVDEPIGNALSLALPRARIVADRAWWRDLRPDERRVVLAHESAHLRRRDPVLLELCSALAALLPRRLAAPLLSAWREHAERQADAAAARCTGDPVAVAAVLVDLHRRARPAALGLAVQDGRGLEGRVRALLDDSTVLHAGADLDRRAAAVLAGVALAPVLASGHVHHAVEWLLRVAA